MLRHTPACCYTDLDFPISTGHHSRIFLLCGGICGCFSAKIKRKLIKNQKICQFILIAINTYKKLLPRDKTRFLWKTYFLMYSLKARWSQIILCGSYSSVTGYPSITFGSHCQGVGQLNIILQYLDLLNLLPKVTWIPAVNLNPIAQLKTSWDLKKSHCATIPERT